MRSLIKEALVTTVMFTIGYIIYNKGRSDENYKIREYLNNVEKGYKMGTKDANKSENKSKKFDPDKRV